MLRRVVILKTNIDKLDYYELLKFCTENDKISNNEKNKIIEKLLDYKKYLDYPKYFEEIKWLDANDRKRFIESISSSNDSQIIYVFSISLKNNLYADEVYMLFNSLYNFNNDDCTKSFIDNFFFFLERNINNIISKICDDKNYSLLMDLWTKYKNYLTDSTEMIVKTISEVFSFPFSIVKNTFDITLVFVTIILCLINHTPFYGLGIGTILTALFIGRIINIYEKKIQLSF